MTNNLEEQHKNIEKIAIEVVLNIGGKRAKLIPPEEREDFFKAIALYMNNREIQARIDEQENQATYFSIKDFESQYGSGQVEWAKIVNEKRENRIAQLKKELKEGGGG